MKLFNPLPPAGADIKTRFVHRDDEKRNEKEEVVNAKEYVFRAGTYLEVDEKAGAYMLKTWQFLQDMSEEDPEIPEAPAHQEVVKPVIDTPPQNSNPSIEDLRNKSFNELKAMYKAKFGKHPRVGTSKKELVDLVFNG